MWNWSENQIKLVLIRHGATQANQEHRYLGKTDESLSPEGIAELKKEKYAGFYPEIDVLFSSPMKRCVETGKILYPDKRAIIIPEWEEMDFGAFEGKNYKDLQGDARYQAWIDSDGTLPFPEGESREEFGSRCEQGFCRMLSQLPKTLLRSDGEKPKRDVTAGVVVHGGTIMSLLSHFYGGDYFDYQVKNGKGYVCTMKYCGEEL